MMFKEQMVVGTENRTNCPDIMWFLALKYVVQVVTTSI